MTVETPAPPAESNEDTPVAPPRPETNPLRLRILQGRYTGPTDVESQLRLSAALARGRRAIPWQYRDNPGDILAVIQQSLALDIQIATALDNLVFSDAGRAGMMARLMHALILRAGHEVIVTHSDERMCRMVIKRGDGIRGGGAQWTLAEAQRAGLLEKKGTPWHGYPGDMLWARCLSRAARRFCPDVIMGFYVADELDDALPDDELDPADVKTTMVDADGNPQVAPDVEAFLEDVDRNDGGVLRARWKQAGQEGLMGAYAGTVDGVVLSVRDLLFAWLSDAEKREQQRRDPAGVVPQDLNAIADAATAQARNNISGPSEPPTPPAAVEPPPPVTGDDAAAGEGLMSCGCPAQAVLMDDGKHQTGCTLPPRRTSR